MQACRRPANFNFDDAYLQRLRNDDPSTGRHFATYFSRLLAWRLGARYRDVNLTEDILQETLRRVLETIRKGTLRDAGRLEPFVNSVCNLVLLEHWRSAKKHAHADLETIASHSNPERIYRRIEAVRRVRSAMQSLPTRDREVLSIVYVEDRDAGEVSVRLRVSRNYARVLVHRALGRLRELC
jgi:RNA polymerase sigma-70 factor (ECF subfamily)